VHPNSPEGNTTETRARTRSTILIGLLGAYCNIVAYGFIYGKGNHEFDLALVNWLRKPWLYPNDPITDAFARFPTAFWPFIASLSQSLDTEKIVFISFLATKVLFFLALAHLVLRTLRDSRLAACVVLAVALSPFLNDFTPFGASDILNNVQTHTSLAVALLLWVGILLLEGRWLAATALWGLTVYINALFALYTLFAFAAFALLDWPRQRREVLVAPLLGAALALPWLLLSRGIGFEKFPKDYLQTLLVFYPFHLNLHSHSVYELASGGGLVVAAFLMARIAAQAGLWRDSRLQALAAAYVFPVALGVFLGELFLTPGLARLQLQRADSFLILYAILLVQIYGANLLLSSRTRGAATTYFLGAMAVLLPLSDLLGLVWPLFAAMLLWTCPQESLERLSRKIAGSEPLRISWLVMLLVGIAVAGRADADWTGAVVVLLVIVGGSFFVYQPRFADLAGGSSRLSLVVCGIACAMLAVGTLPKISMIWYPVPPPAPLDADWHEVQAWAKSHTPMDAQFLVPTFPGGFRVFSERSSWGEWKDGQAAYHFPPFADVYRERMQALGFPWRPEWIGTKAMMANCKRLSWERLLSVARANHLSYIIQFRDVNYPAKPVLANRSYAVYQVPP
jgi:hypothetical protein